MSLAKLAAQASAKEVLQTEKRLNNQPNPAGWQARMTQPENFAYGSKVRTTFRPDIDLSTGDVGYTTTATGRGRRSMELESTNHYRDIPQVLRPNGETDEEYLARREQNIQNASEPYKLWGGIGHGVNLASLAGGAVLGGRAGGAKGATVGGLAGLAAGGLANLIAHGIGRGQMNHRYIESLTPEERDLLLSIKRSDADELSQDALAGHRVTGRSYYIY